MKRFIFKNLPIILLALLCSGISYAQKKHTITLYVNTAEVSMENIESTCNFGQDPEISNEAYSIYVEKGDTVEWIGKSTSSEEDIVEIRKIIYSSGTNFFDTETLRDRDGIVTGLITNGESEDYEKYNIEFKVYRNGKWVRETFPIDPKLRVRKVIIRGDD